MKEKTVLIKLKDILYRKQTICFPKTGLVEIRFINDSQEASTAPV